MLKSGVKIPVCVFCIFILTKCIDPYYPELGKYQSLLVVEGLMTDSDTPVVVKLARTFQSVDSVPEKVSGATLYVTDENDNRTDLYYSGNGIYKSDSSAGFIGQTGKTYTLHIMTDDGNKYLSEPYAMLPAPEIDSVFYSREEMLDNTTGNNLAGISIRLNSEKNWDDEGFLRWEYEETWKFKLPSPQKFVYVSDSEIIELSDIREYCWKTNKSSEILINSILPGINSVQNEPLLFIPPVLSDRLTIQYSIIVRQYSISPKEYNFWNNLKQVNETGGDIFDTQPYPVISNIYNVDNPEEKVLGYFKVSSVKEKRIYIMPKDIRGLGIPEFKYPCTEYIVSPENYPPSHELGHWLTWDELNEMFMAAGGFIFVRPVYIGLTDGLSKLVYAPEECSDCTLSGSITPPDFWIDLQ